MASRRQATLGKFLNGNSAKSKHTTAASVVERGSEVKSTEDDKHNLEPKRTTTKQSVSNGTPESSSSAVVTNDLQSRSPQWEKASGEEAEDDSDEQPVVKRRKTSSKDSSSSSKLVGNNPTTNGRGDSRTATKDSDASTTPLKNGGASESDEEMCDAKEASDVDMGDKTAEANKKSKKIQAPVQIVGQDPYPDWKSGEPVPYAALCTTFSLVEMTTKRLEISAHCARFLQQVLRLTPEDVLSTVQLMINKVAADYAGIELGIGESLIIKAISESTGRSLAETKADHHKIGDLGLVAAKSRSNQRTMFKPKALTVKRVHEGLLTIASLQGHGSQDRKVSSIMKLLSSADAGAAKGAKGIDVTCNKGGASESKFLIRFLEGKLRLGLAERTVIVALAQAMVKHEATQKGNKIPSSEQMAQGEAILKTVYSELPSYEVIIPQMLEHGIFNLRDKCRLQPGVPLKPMLAKPTKSITEVLDRFEGKDFTCEYKYDGERAQIHYVAPDSEQQYPTAKATLQKDAGAKGLSSIFSRNSEDLSKKYPDILAKLDSWIKPATKSFVLDCETVAWDKETKKVLPFQQLMTRKRKDVKAEDVKVKVCVFAFDILFLNGEATVNKTFRERRAFLHSAFEPVEGEFAFAQFGNSKEIDEIQTLLDESVKASCEGLMVKMLDSEESGYEPSKRSRNWLKVKKDYLSGIGDSLDLVVLGAYYGKGKRTSVYGAFLLAAYNPTDQVYETVCNIGTGFSEAVLEDLHSTLSEHVIDRPKPFYSHSTVRNDQPDVWFDARTVWEVKAADLTLSPRYRAAADEMAVNGNGNGNGNGNNKGKGISLRFPRFVKSRDDKKPDEATTTKAVAEMYRRQESVAKEVGKGGGGGGGGVDDDFEY